MQNLSTKKLAFTPLYRCFYWSVYHFWSRLISGMFALNLAAHLYLDINDISTEPLWSSDLYCSATVKDAINVYLLNKMTRNLIHIFISPLTTNYTDSSKFLLPKSESHALVLLAHDTIWFDGFLHELTAWNSLNACRCRQVQESHFSFFFLF